MNGYFLRGLEDHILVFRSLDPEDLLRVITRLGASRDKQIKAIANKLEMEFYDRDREHSQQVKQEDARAGNDRNAKRTRKNGTPKPGTE